MGLQLQCVPLTYWLLQFDFRSHGRDQLEKFIGEWETPQIAKWLAFHKLGKYQAAFSTTTGKVCGCLNNGPLRILSAGGCSVVSPPSQQPAAQPTAACA